jgi:hypothetical protein
MEYRQCNPKSNGETIMNDKDLFLFTVEETIQAHPEWTADTFRAIQYGLNDRIELEQEASSKLTLGFSYLWDQAPERTRIKVFPFISEQLKVLSNRMSGSTFSKNLCAFIEDQMEK